MSLTPNNDNPPVLMASVSLHSGALPSPETVERYEHILPGAFDRILTMAEKEQESKIKINHDTVSITKHENRSIWTSILWGQTFGFISIVIYFIILAITMLLGNTVMFTALFCAGAFAGLANLVRSFQVRNKSDDVPAKK